MKRFFTLSIIVLSLSSCAFHSGTIIGSNFVNQKIKNTAWGTAKAQYIFGIGGLQTDALVYEAKVDLYSNYPLKEREAYSNFTINFKTTVYPFFSERKVTLTADIVEISNYSKTKDEAVEIIKPITIDSITNHNLERMNDHFKLGDKVWIPFDNSWIDARIMSTNNGEVTVEYKNISGSIYTKTIDENYVYLNEQREINSFNQKIGDKVEISTYGEAIGIVPVTVIGLGIKKNLLKHTDSTLTKYYMRPL